MNAVLRTNAFDKWLRRLSDHQGKARIIERIRTFERGNFGDRAFVGRGVSEIRIHYGPGYRIYYCRTGVAVYILLCGGTKGTQQRDIAKAQSMLARLQRN